MCHFSLFSFFCESYCYRRDLLSFPTRRSSDLVSLFVQIETAAGVENAAEIAAVDGVDGVFEIGRDTSELQSRGHLVCRLLLEKKKETEGECPGMTLKGG